MGEPLYFILRLWQKYVTEWKKNFWVWKMIIDAQSDLQKEWIWSK